MAGTGVAVFVAAWQAYAVLGPLEPDVLPSPARIAEAGWADRESLARNIWPTMVEVGLGFGVAVLAAFVVSVLLDRWRPARRAVLPLLIGSQTVPIIVLAPLVVIWFGFGLGPKVAIVALVTFFPVVVALLDGYATTDRTLTTLLETVGAGWWRRFRLLRLPSALPVFFTGVRVSVTYAVVAAVFAEYAGAESGLAVYLRAAQSSRRTDLVLAAVVVISVVSVALYVSTVLLQRRVMPWYADSRRSQR